MSIPKVIAGVVFNVALYALLLFVPADTLHWWRAWVFLAVTVAVMVVAIFSILPDNADLFSQRAKGIIQKGQPLWDRILVILLVVSYVGQIVFIPLMSSGSIWRQNQAARFIYRACALRRRLVDHDSCDESQPFRRARH
jgi:hypothetical protein